MSDVQTGQGRSNSRHDPLLSRLLTRLLLTMIVAGCGGKEGGGPATAPLRPLVADGQPKPVTDAGLSVMHDSDWFEDRTAQSGVEFRYQNGRSANRLTILETVGGGVALLDYDLDGKIDLFCAGGGTIDAATSEPSGVACGFFRNGGGGQFADVTRSAAIQQATDYSHGCVSGDLNNDGFPDLLVTCYGRNCLMVNQGDGTFADDTDQSGLVLETWNSAAALGDVNRDGNLDVFICGYVDWKPSMPSPPASAGRKPDVAMPQLYSPLPDHLLLSQGDGQFRESSEKAGIRRDGMGLGVVACDLNQDGFIDFYVANDVVANHLYWGGPALPLREAGEVTGTAYSESGTPEGSMGVDSADVNGDGQFDLWVTNFELEDNSLYLNAGEGLFQHSTSALGLGGSTRPFVKFGTGFCDFDSDGWPDLYVLSGHVRYHTGIRPFEQPAFLYRNDQGHRFVDVSADAGTWFRIPHAGRGGAVGDLDDDGAPDLIVGAIDEPVAILRNRRPAPNWTRVNLVGTRSPRTAAGATLRIHAFDRDIVYPLASGGGYLSQSDSRLLIALERSAEHVDIRVDWPSGSQELFQKCAVRREVVLVEGRGIAAGRPTGSETDRE